PPRSPLLPYTTLFRSIPVGTELVRGLVVVLARVDLQLLLPPACRLADEIDTGLCIHGGHADLRKAELIGSIERAAIRERIAGDHPALHACDVLDDGIKRGLAFPDEDDVLGATPDIRAVEVDVGGNLAGRHSRIGGKVLRAEQALLLRCDEEQHDRAPRRCW